VTRPSLSKRTLETAYTVMTSPFAAVCAEAEGNGAVPRDVGHQRSEYVIQLETKIGADLRGLVAYLGRF
jgi:hypothetical protein